MGSKSNLVVNREILIRKLWDARIRFYFLFFVNLVAMISGVAAILAYKSYILVALFAVCVLTFVRAMNTYNRMSGYLVEQIKDIEEKMEAQQ